MSLSPGTRLGSYEIVAPLGAGGMGEVYRAHDARLDRQVAIKVLPKAVADDPNRLERFSREARAVSALNHPNILTIHELGTHEGSPYIVTELLEGGDLGAVINRRPLPPRKVVEYALQMLDGLAAAHEKGIVHRDLKPANIFITREGRVKILDFGLAKVVEHVNDDVTRQDLTGSGVVLGTAGYMAPEQIRGARADQRSDLFAFGAILYEMLSGRPAFARGTGVETMTAVLNEEPPELTAGTAPVHPALEKIVRRCLEKEADRRFRSATDLGFAIGTVQTLSDSHPGAAPPVSGRSRGLIAAAAVAALILLGLAAIQARSWWSPAPAAIDRPFLQFSLTAPRNTVIIHVAVSPDGRWVAFTAATGPKVQLWVRPTGADTPRALAGTEGATLPFWSPDSRNIGYFAGGKLRRIEPGGGASTALADVGVSTGGSWSRDGVILFGALGGSGLSKVPSAGGAVEQVMAPDATRSESDYSNPLFLPDGNHFLFNVFSGQREGRGTFLSSLDGRERKRIVDDSSNVGLADVPGVGAFLFFARESALMAQRFDLQSLQVVGEPAPMTDVVGSTFDSTGTGVTRRTFTVSNTGLVIFDPVPTRLDSHLFWIDRNGGNERILEDMNHVGMVRLSRDGKHFVVAKLEGDRGNLDLWLAPSDGGRANRFTFDPGNDPFPVWANDGSHIAWASNRDGVYRIYRKAASGSGGDELFLGLPSFTLPTDWSPDGRHILYRMIDPKTHYDIWALATEAGAKPFAVLKTEANEAAAVVSPDGKWLAYASDETGRYEIYVQNFPGGGGKRQVSTIGGNGPIWRADGRELFFHAADGVLMAVGVTPASGAIADVAMPLFPFAPGGNLITPYYSVTPDGNRFLVSKMVEHARDTPLSVLVDWPARLQGR